MRVLDELADAFRSARRHEGRAVRSSVRIHEQFEYPVTAARWAAVERHLGCPAAATVLRAGPLVATGRVGNGVGSGRDRRAESEPPAERTVEACKEAQIFAGVQAVLVDAGSLEP